MKKMRGSFFLLAVLVTGCIFFTSWGRVMEGWVGEPIRRITSLWGEPDEIRTRDDGRVLYEYHLEDLDPSCIHYWIVDPEDIIIGLYYEGYCHPVG